MIDSHRDEIAKLESLYAMNPEGRVFTHLAEAYRKAGQLDRARQILEDGLQKHPDYASAHVVLGRVFADSGEDDAAAGEFRRVLELDRHNLVALRSLGAIASRAGRTDEASHYYGELAVLDPTDPEIQETLRRLRDHVAAVPVEPAESGAPAVEAAARERPDEGVGAGDDMKLEIESTGHAGADRIDEVEPLEGLESAQVEAEPSDVWPEATADLPEWPSVESVEAEAEPEVDDSERYEGAAGEITMPPLKEDHMRFVPPGMFGRPAPQTDAEATPTADLAGGGSDEPEAGVEAADSDETVPREADSTTEDEPGPEVEGRWQAPESTHVDAQAERSRPTDHSGEWIPEDRWEWVAASADTSGSEGSEEPEAESDETSSPDPGEEGEPPAWDEETSFAGLAEETSFAGLAGEGTSFGGMADDEDVPQSYGVDDEITFAGLTEEDGEELTLEAETDEEVSFAGIAESEPVDSFEEGAAAVLDAFARFEDEPESDDSPAPPSEPPFVTSAGEHEAPVKWVTDSEDDGDLVITETLAEIYASQGLYDRAAAVYRRLIVQHPADDRLHARLADLESATGWAAPAEQEGEAEEDREAFLERVESAWTGGEGAAGMEDSPYAWSEPAAEEAEAGPRAGDYFARLLAWRPTEAVPSTAYESPDREAAPLPEDWYAEEAEREPAPDEEGEVGREGEEDLEMFRSWLKSLKK